MWAIIFASVSKFITYFNIYKLPIETVSVIIFYLQLFFFLYGGINHRSHVQPEKSTPRPVPHKRFSTNYMYIVMEPSFSCIGCSLSFLLRIRRCGCFDPIHEIGDPCKDTRDPLMAARSCPAHYAMQFPLVTVAIGFGANVRTATISLSE